MSKELLGLKQLQKALEEFIRLLFPCSLPVE
jgi:hypothetical protein